MHDFPGLSPWGPGQRDGGRVGGWAARLRSSKAVWHSPSLAFSSAEFGALLPWVMHLPEPFQLILIMIAATIYFIE